MKIGGSNKDQLEDLEKFFQNMPKTRISFSPDTTVQNLPGGTDGTCKMIFRNAKGNFESFCFNFQAKNVGTTLK